MQELATKIGSIVGIILAIILIIALLVALAFCIVCLFEENKRRKEFIEQSTEKEKALIMEYESIKANPFKKIERKK